MTRSNHINTKKKYLIKLDFPSITYNLLIAFVFTILKLTNVIDWDWIWVLHPLWLPYLLILAIFLFFFILSLIGFIYPFKEM